jgi:hypothetical protein
MARDKTKVKDYDQFQLRLPPGMRERIKIKAERAGMSMNEAIVWCLEKEFPEPASIEKRLADLANMVSMLVDSKDPYAGVENLIHEIEQTLERVGSKELPADPGFAEMVHERLEYWRELEIDNWRERNESPFDDANWTGNIDYEAPPGEPFDDIPYKNDKDKG